MVLRSVADAILRLDFSPTLPSSKKEDCQNWMTFTKCWCALQHAYDNSIATHEESMTHVFANYSDEEDIYPLTVKEIAEAQSKDKAI